MDIARFHFALDTTIYDLRITGVIDHLAKLINTLSNVINNPGNVQYIQHYKEQLDAMKIAFEESSLNHPKLELADFIEQFELEDFVGLGLFVRIKRVIEENQLTPHAAVQALQELLSKVSKKIADLDSINTAFSALNVPYAGEGDGDSEIEIKIPVDAETKTLHDLALEAKEWHRDISVISEVFDPNRNEATIRTLATGSWQFYLASAPLVIFGVAKCIRGVNSVLTELIKTKELLGKLVESKAPNGVIEEYEKHLKDSVGTQLSALASEFVEQHYKGDDNGRRSELKIALTQSLKRLSKKISEGSMVRLRLTKPAMPKIADKENPSDQEIEAIENARKIEEVRDATMLELDMIEHLEHDPEIVKSLPAPEVENTI